MIYLDNAATTYPKPECVYQALDYANRNNAFNSGRGSYKESADAEKIIMDTRNALSSLVKKNEDSVVFASSATEALNQIIYGLPLKQGDIVLVSPFEHNAVVRPLHLLEKTRGIEVVQIPFDRKTWKLDEMEYVNLLAMKKTKAVFVSQISNVTGYLIPYWEVFKLAKEHSVITILDASQGFGIVPIHDTSSIDFLVFAGHKSLYASFGVAGFIICGKDILTSVKAGGTGSDSLNLDMANSGAKKYEAGSSNIVAIAGLNASICWLKDQQIEQHEKELTAYLIKRLRGLNNMKLYVPESEEVFGIVSVSVDGYSPSDVGTILYDEYGIAVRTGFHCAPYIHQFIGSELVGGTVRVSLGAFSTISDIDSLICALETL